jgi:diguanylate cyclase (GGDEF)-like protein
MNRLNNKFHLISYKEVLSIVIIISIILLNSTFTFSQSKESEEVTIGVLSFASKEDTVSKWQALADYLTDTVEGQEFKIKAMFYTEFQDCILEGNVDYILTNPAHFISISQEYELSGAIATLTEMSGGKAQFGFGGVIFTRNTPDTPSTISDLKGKTISAVALDSLGGYQASAYELKKAGIDPEKDLEIVLTGMPHNNTIDMVLAGQADAGFVRSGVIEKLIKAGELDKDALKIINEQNFTNFDQYISTTMYPEWPFIALSHIEPKQAQRVAASLYLMDDSPEYTERIGIFGFTIPSNYLEVEILMRELKLPPFDKEEQITLFGVWRQYYFELIITLVLIITVISYAVYKSRVGKILSAQNEELNNLTLKLRESNINLTEISIKDSLTGLYNRRHFEVFIRNTLNMIKIHNTTLSICVIDIDNFKQYNDNYGHNIGDLVLIEVAKNLQAHVNDINDIVARYAGDEFVIVFYDAAPHALKANAQKIIRGINKMEIKLPNSDEKLKVSISMGVTTTRPKCNHTSEEVFKSADNALFRAKEEGKNRYVFEDCSCIGCSDNTQNGESF